MAIRVKSNEVFNVTQSGGKNGAILSMNLECGECSFKFPRRYSLAQLAQGFPHETCPNCDTVNYVPYTIAGRGDARG